MRHKKTWWIVGVLAVIILTAVYGVHESWVESKSSGGAIVPQQKVSLSPSPGKVVMIDLGAKQCVPCKLMAPIIDELQKEYSGKADIIFIDVWKQPDAVKEYMIQVIPTQIFFDADGREVYRHVGFMDKKSIVDVLSKLGVS